MNPIFQAVLITILRLKRTCRGCNKDQVVPVSKRHDTVQCKFCGAHIPPRK